MSTAINAALSCDGNTEIQMNSGLNLRPLGGYQKGKQSISKKVVTLTVKEQPAEKEKEERTRKKTRKLGHYKAPKARSVSRLPETQNATRNQKRNEDNMSKEKWAKLRPVIRFGHTFLKMLDHTITAKRKLKRCMRAVLITVRLRRGLKEHLSHSEIKQLEYLYKCSVDQGVNLSKATEIRLFLAANKCCMQEQELQLLLSRVRFEEDKEAISMDSLIELLAYRKWQRRMEQGREQSAVLEMLTNLSENDIREWLQTVTSIGVRIDVGIANKSDTLNKLLLLSGAASSESNRSSAKNGSTKQQSTTVYNESPQQNTAIDQEVILLDGTVNIEAITVRLRCTHQRHVDDISLLKRRLQFLDKLKNTPAETDGIKLRWNMLRDVAQDGVIRSVAVPRLGGSVSSRKESQRFSNELTKSKIIPQSGTGIKAQSAGGGAKVRIPYHFSLGEKTHRHRRTSDSSKSSKLMHAPSPPSNFNTQILLNNRHWQHPIVETLAKPLPPLPPRSPRRPSGRPLLNTPASLLDPYAKPQFITRRCFLSKNKTSPVAVKQLVAAGAIHG